MSLTGTATRRFYIAFYQWNQLHHFHASASLAAKPIKRAAKKAAKKAAREAVIRDPSKTYSTVFNDLRQTARNTGPRFRIRRHVSEYRLGEDDSPPRPPWRGQPVQSVSERPFSSLRPWDSALRQSSDSGRVLEAAIPKYIIGALQGRYGPDLSGLTQSIGARLKISMPVPRDRGVDVCSVLISGSYEDTFHAWQAFKREEAAQDRTLEEEPELAIYRPRTFVNPGPVKTPPNTQHSDASDFPSDLRHGPRSTIRLRPSTVHLRLTELTDLRPRQAPVGQNERSQFAGSASDATLSNAAASTANGFSMVTSGSTESGAAKDKAPPISSTRPPGISEVRLIEPVPAQDAVTPQREHHRPADQNRSTKDVSIPTLRSLPICSLSDLPSHTLEAWKSVVRSRTADMVLLEFAVPSLRLAVIRMKFGEQLETLSNKWSCLISVSPTYKATVNTHMYTELNECHTITFSGRLDNVVRTWNTVYRFSNPRYFRLAVLELGRPDLLPTLEQSGDRVSASWRTMLLGEPSSHFTMPSQSIPVGRRVLRSRSPDGTTITIEQIVSSSTWAAIEEEGGIAWILKLIGPATGGPRVRIDVGPELVARSASDGSEIKSRSIMMQGSAVELLKIDDVLSRPRRVRKDANLINPDTQVAKNASAEASIEAPVEAPTESTNEAHVREDLEQWGELSSMVDEPASDSTLPSARNQIQRQSPMHGPRILSARPLLSSAPVKHGYHTISRSGHQKQPPQSEVASMLDMDADHTQGRQAADTAPKHDNAAILGDFTEMRISLPDDDTTKIINGRGRNTFKWIQAMSKAKLQIVRRESTRCLQLTGSRKSVDLAIELIQEILMHTRRREARRQADSESGGDDSILSRYWAQLLLMPGADPARLQHVGDYLYAPFGGELRRLQYQADVYWIRMQDDSPVEPGDLEQERIEGRILGIKGRSEEVVTAALESLRQKIEKAMGPGPPVPAFKVIRRWKETGLGTPAVHIVEDGDAESARSDVIESDPERSGSSDDILVIERNHKSDVAPGQGEYQPPVPTATDLHLDQSTTTGVNGTSAEEKRCEGIYDGSVAGRDPMVNDMRGWRNSGPRDQEQSKELQMPDSDPEFREAEMTTRVKLPAEAWTYMIADGARVYHLIEKQAGVKLRKWRRRHGGGVLTIDGEPEHVVLASQLVQEVAGYAKRRTQILGSSARSEHSHYIMDVALLPNCGEDVRRVVMLHLLGNHAYELKRIQHQTCTTIGVRSSDGRKSDPGEILRIIGSSWEEIVSAHRKLVQKLLEFPGLDVSRRDALQVLTRWHEKNGKVEEVLDLPHTGRTGVGVSASQTDQKQWFMQLELVPALPDHARLVIQSAFPLHILKRLGSVTGTRIALASVDSGNFLLSGFKAGVERARRLVEARVHRKLEDMQVDGVGRGLVLSEELASGPLSTPPTVISEHDQFIARTTAITDVTPPKDAEQLASNLRAVLRPLTHPVVVLTARAYPTVWPIDLEQGVQCCRGVTVSSFTSITLHPTPVVSFNLKLPSRTWDAMQTSRQVCAHIFAATPEAAAIVDSFTRSHEDPATPFRNLRDLGAEVRLDRGWADPPEIAKDGAVIAKINMDLLTDECKIIGDHVLAIARVSKVQAFVDGSWRPMDAVKHLASEDGLGYSVGVYRRIGQAINVPTKMAGPKSRHPTPKQIQQDLETIEEQYAHVFAPLKPDASEPVLKGPGSVGFDRFRDLPDDFAVGTPQASNSRENEDDLDLDSNAPARTQPNDNQIEDDFGVLHEETTYDRRSFPGTFRTRPLRQPPAIRSYSTKAGPRNPSQKKSPLDLNSLVTEPGLLKQTLAEFLGETGEYKIPGRMNALLGAQRAALKASRELEWAMQNGMLTPERSLELEHTISTNERRVTKTLALRAAGELRRMLNTGKVDLRRSQWLEMAVEKGIVVNWDEAREAKEMFERKEIRPEVYEPMMEKLQSEYEFLSQSAARLRAMVEEEVDGGFFDGGDDD